MNGKLTWIRTTIAEDELSKLERQTTKSETDEQIRSALDALVGDDFFADLRHMVEECDKLLQDGRLPTTGERIWVHPDGTWKRSVSGMSASDFPRRPWSLRPAALWVQEQTANFADDWYAARIGWKCRLYLEHIEKGDFSQAVIHKMAFEIGYLQADWRFRAAHKPSAMTGRKQRRYLDGLRNIQNRKVQQNVTRRQKIVAAMIEETDLKGGALDKWLSRQLSEKHDIQVSERTIRSDRKAIGESP